MTRKELLKELANWKPGAVKWLDFNYGETNFHITKCKTTGEFCVGVANVMGLYKKSYTTIKEVVEYVFGEGE